MDDRRPDDAELAARLAIDLDGSFEALVVAHQDRLFTIAVRTGGDRHDAEELVQDAFVRAYRALAAWPAARIRDLRLRGRRTTILLNAGRNRAGAPGSGPCDAGRGRAGRRLCRDRLARRTAPRGLERARRGGGVRGDRRCRIRVAISRPDRPCRPTPRRAARRAGPEDRAAPRRRPSQPDRPGPARLDAVRPGRLDEGPRNPACRGPAARLDHEPERQADRGA